MLPCFDRVLSPHLKASQEIHIDFVTDTWHLEGVPISQAELDALRLEVGPLGRPDRDQEAAHIRAQALAADPDYQAYLAAQRINAVED